MNSSLSSQSLEEANSPSLSPFVRRLLILVLLFILGSAIGFPILGLLGFGWIQFLSRVIPKISWNWDLVGMGVLCVAGLLGIGHVFMKWLTGQISTARGTPWSWPWRWTWCGAAGVGLLFLVGMAVGGIFHQAGWMMASHEPLYEIKGGFSAMSDLEQFHVALRMALDDSKGNCQQARQQLRKSQNEYLPARPGQAAPGERVVCLLMVDSYGQCFGAILFPRMKSQQSRRNQLLYWHQEQKAWLPMSELGSLLRKHQRQLVAL